VYIIKLKDLKLFLFGLEEYLTSCSDIYVECVRLNVIKDSALHFCCHNNRYTEYSILLILVCVLNSSMFCSICYVKQRENHHSLLTSYHRTLQRRL